MGSKYNTESVVPCWHLLHLSNHRPLVLLLLKLLLLLAGLSLNESVLSHLQAAHIQSQQAHMQRCATPQEPVAGRAAQMRTVRAPAPHSVRRHHCYELPTLPASPSLSRALSANSASSSTLPRQYSSAAAQHERRRGAAAHRLPLSMVRSPGLLFERGYTSALTSR